jgi:hypothetical protein
MIRHESRVTFLVMIEVGSRVQLSHIPQVESVPFAELDVAEERGFGLSHAAVER